MADSVTNTIGWVARFDGAVKFQFVGQCGGAKAPSGRGLSPKVTEGESLKVLYFFHK